MIISVILLMTAIKSDTSLSTAKESIMVCSSELSFLSRQELYKREDGMCIIFIMII